AARVIGSPPQADLRAGRTFELSGRVIKGGEAPEVTLDHAVPVENELTIQPVRATVQDLASGKLQYRLVTIEGAVKAAYVDHAGRLMLVVRNGDQEVRTFVRDAPRPDLNAYADRTVRVEGVLAAS